MAEPDCTPECQPRVLPLDGPRKNYLTWDEYFMGIAVLSAQRSKDPNRQVGACIVDDNKRIMGIGYNGFPKGCSDDVLPWGGKERLRGKEAPDMVMGIDDPVFLQTKYPFVCHAEANAILNCHSRMLNGCTIYVAMFPCNECTKLIIQSGITKVVFLSDKNHSHPGWVAARKMLDLAKVEYTPFTSQRECDTTTITLSLSNHDCSAGIDSLPPLVDKGDKKDRKDKRDKKDKSSKHSDAPPSYGAGAVAYAFAAGMFLGLLVNNVKRSSR
eukprot:TRINITY_DN23967_c0_g2_i3.p1 TRINITY_DN23967_c0_g2~~TRINITY_DN23967_c0_g2_i3.p1  ORF type:complete len:307 (+),score=113.05 TRINITY_DN23967_c0_g2_i3:113-922(+)